MLVLSYFEIVFVSCLSVEIFPLFLRDIMLQDSPSQDLQNFWKTNAHLGKFHYLRLICLRNWMRLNRNSQFITESHDRLEFRSVIKPDIDGESNNQGFLVARKCSKSFSKMEAIILIGHNSCFKTLSALCCKSCHIW